MHIYYSDKIIYNIPTQKNTILYYNIKVLYYYKCKLITLDGVYVVIILLLRLKS